MGTVGLISQVTLTLNLTLSCPTDIHKPVEYYSTGGCSGITTVSRVRIMVKVTVRDRCVKLLMWYHDIDVVYPGLSNCRTCLQ